MEQDLIQGSVVLFGTPAEESSSGKINFVKEKIVQDKVDFAMMLVSKKKKRGEMYKEIG
jgi:metal-dependent amidase/aminoacylase/carboxypeptidase family protein